MLVGCPVPGAVVSLPPCRCSPLGALAISPFGAVHMTRSARPPPGAIARVRTEMGSLTFISGPRAPLLAGLLVLGLVFGGLPCVWLLHGSQTSLHASAL